MPRLGRRDQVRAWVMIILSSLMTITGLALAIHDFSILDLIPIAVGAASMLVAIRLLTHRRVF